MDWKKSKNVAVIVAHPDDETLWTGGTILSHPLWKTFVVCLCRGSDADRAPKFYEALKILNSKGVMGDLDDSPEQSPLVENEVERTIMEFLPKEDFDIIITHNPAGEYTKHLRHEETSSAVIKLWHTGKISSTELWTFAYEDGNRMYYPKPIENANLYSKLTRRIWLKKYSIITHTYGFKKNSFEAKTTPKAEAFWRFVNPYEAEEWLNQFEAFKMISFNS